MLMCFKHVRFKVVFVKPSVETIIFSCFCFYWRGRRPSHHPQHMFYIELVYYLIDFLVVVIQYPLLVLLFKREITQILVRLCYFSNDNHTF